MKFNGIKPDDIIFPGKGKAKLPKLPSLFILVPIIIGIILLFAISTVFYTIQPDEVGVV